MIRSTISRGQFSNKIIERKFPSAEELRRKAIRKVKKGIVDNEKDNEKSESYVAGGF